MGSGFRNRHSKWFGCDPSPVRRHERQDRSGWSSMVNPINRWIDMAAAPMGRAYRPWTTLQDIKQHLWSWVYANEQKVADYLTHPDGERIIRSILNQEARNFAIKERAAVSGY